LFFTIRGHSNHSQKCSGSSENPMQYFATNEPYYQIQHYTRIGEIRREQCKKDCPHSVSECQTHESVRMKPFFGNSESICIRTGHLTFRTRM
jgi:hypothetical protein